MHAPWCDSVTDAPQRNVIARHRNRADTQSVVSDADRKSRRRASKRADSSVRDCWTELLVEKRKRLGGGPRRLVLCHAGSAPTCHDDEQHAARERCACDRRKEKRTVRSQHVHVELPLRAGLLTRRAAETARRTGDRNLRTALPPAFAERKPGRRSGKLAMCSPSTRIDCAWLRD